MPFIGWKFFKQIGHLIDIGSFIYHHKFTNGLIEHELDHVLIGEYKGDPINPNPLEIDDISWEYLDFFENWLMSSQSDFTVWLQLAWNIVKVNLDKIFWYFLYIIKIIYFDSFIFIS